MAERKNVYSEGEIKIILDEIKKEQDEGIALVLPAYKKAQNLYQSTSEVLVAVDNKGVFYNNINRGVKELFSQFVSNIAYNLKLGLGAGLSCSG
ncbi:MAG: hypothetical protein US71_C0001G0097 [Parcubacteria group bacterium GW2011_GWD2_38_12]|uniref:Uncharacterized protein n=1 Tax=Candidatus Azambacteria bacterium RIFCSPLOWO2_01_FULL_37_9 TaxID=1797297 RepID=A0A1F5C5S1_9BACT|nr:MAG: hypothetical protein US06_C0002G0009 [Parcubacteria group bacterium GW2011_GWC2_36_17]KKQ42376.1 MAG: hypothetical protein US61_C0027G0005 [Parcubacteria group bacterium GW2011_GWE2_37_8]KKQ52894.1 MAG: hypothetical protein US71_C0001G0097 [Parcubacteria group bacterium GW2011_GWD2_38_12]KKQ59097.1 MAG: hypothetical protein US79_C0001G0096 [Parcubacteria group bacterium GW2011_GWC1_38_17]KKQ59712.1 MAG: hypothetical protein US78_C0001G0072 [Parcubacteria group bacterium GW2011_GWD1_38_1